MISSIHAQEFKCFSDLKLSFGKLTLTTGFNGGGKSTAIQPLLLLAQGLDRTSEPYVFPLNGRLARLGSVGDVIPAKGSGQLRFTVSDGQSSAIWSLSGKAGDRHLIAETAPGNGPPVAQGTVIDDLTRLVFLSAVRGGTAESHPFADTSDRGFYDIGINGQFAAHWYSLKVDDEIDEARRHPDEPATSFRKQLDAWLGDLFPGAQANVQAIHQIARLGLEFRLSDISPWTKPANIGYGLTYCFPIIVALLAASPGQTIVIDSPEAHLHPSAQSKMGKLLAQFAAAGVQIIVETHSDHLLSGARLSVKEGRLAAADLVIHFFTGAHWPDHGVTTPVVDSEGRVSEWPEGFFDQSEKDLSALAGWV